MSDDSDVARRSALFSTQPSIQLSTRLPTPPRAEPVRRLVIADDSPEMRYLVRGAVGDQFADVVEVGDGRQLMWTLLRLFMADRGHGPEIVVITDFCMPTYDGLAVLDAWTELDCDIPLIVITAFPTAVVHARARELGAIVLAKPFSTAALRRFLGEILERRTAMPCAPLLA